MIHYLKFVFYKCDSSKPTNSLGEISLGLAQSVFDSVSLISRAHWGQEKPRLGNLQAIRNGQIQHFVCQKKGMLSLSMAMIHAHLRVSDI